MREPQKKKNQKSENLSFSHLKFVFNDEDCIHYNFWRRQKKNVNHNIFGKKWFFSPMKSVFWVSCFCADEMWKVAARRLYLLFTMLWNEIWSIRRYRFRWKIIEINCNRWNKPFHGRTQMISWFLSNAAFNDTTLLWVFSYFLFHWQPRPVYCWFWFEELIPKQFLWNWIQWTYHFQFNDDE